MPRRQLSVLESERAIAILDDTIEKIKSLDTVKTDILQHRNELSKTLGSTEISKGIQLYKLQEKQYNQLLEQRSEIKATANKKKYKEIQEEIQDLSRSIKESTNSLTRSLKENPTISNNMTKVYRDRNDLRDLLLRCTQELRDHRTFRTIQLKVEEEHTAQSRLQDLKITEKNLRDTVYQLQQQSIDEQINLSNTISDKKSEILQLRAEIHAIKNSASINSSFKRKESHAHVAAIWREYKSQQREMEIKCKENDIQTKTEGIVCTETKDFLIRKTARLNEDLKLWEIKYDNDIGDIDESIKKATNERNKLIEKLTLLKERDDDEKKQQHDQNIQMSIDNANNLEKRCYDMRQNRSACKIQKMMMMYMKHLKSTSNGSSSSSSGKSKVKSGKKKDEGGSKTAKKKK